MEWGADGAAQVSYVSECGSDASLAANENRPLVPTGDPELVRRFRLSISDPKQKKQLSRLLAKTAFFSDCALDFRCSICDGVWPVSYRASETIFKLGEPGDWMGIVISGKLQRSLQHHKVLIDVGDCGPGSIIGDLGLVGLHNRRSFTVSVKSDAVLLVLTRQIFDACVLQHGGPRACQMFEDMKAMKGIMSDAGTFLKLTCFQGLDADFVMSLRSNSEPRLCYPGQVLMRENAFGNEMFILRCGTVRVERGGVIVADLGSTTDFSQGIVLGELAVLGLDKRRMATVTCTSLCLIRVLHGEDFHSMLDEHPRARRVFDHRYIARLVAVNLQQVHEERVKYDNFYGSAAPRTTKQMEDLLAKNEPAPIRDKDPEPLSPSRATPRLPPIPTAAAAKA